MLIKCITVGALETNCYIVADESTLECAVIDPGADASTILDYLEETKLSCRFVLLTHGHFDHTGAVNDILAETEARLFMQTNHGEIAGHFEEGGSGTWIVEALARFKERD